MKKMTKKNSIITAVFITAIIITNLIVSQFIDYWLSSLLVSFVTAVSLSVIGYGIYLCLTTLIDRSDFREKLFNGVIIFIIVMVGAGIYQWFIDNNIATKTAGIYDRFINNNKDNEDNLINTFRETKLLFQINYPKNWVITDYVDYGEDRGTVFKIASNLEPPQWWFLGEHMPGGYALVEMAIRPNGTYVDYYKDEENVIKTDSEEIDIGGGSKLNIITYDYKDQFGVKVHDLPTAVGYYYGSNYLYTFEIPRWSPNTEEEIDIFKQIVGSFKEIK